MHSWTSPEFAPLPGSGALPRLHDTRSGGIRTVVPVQEGRASLYTCGITPYDSTHMGHAATYHAADLMRRALADAGLEVRHAQNITDVDDPLFERAERDGVDWRDLARSQVDLFAGDMEALRILPPQDYISVSESIEAIIATVLDTHRRGRAYALPADDAEEPGAQDWYVDLAQDRALGTVSGWTRAQMMEVFAERGGDPDRAGKRDPFDPLLWQAARPGEPAWEAGELGRGRPGWHVECLAISQQSLGLPFDVQAGGRDLIFPHHDLGNAHAAALGEPFAALYAHVGMVAYEGTKMSKSLGNLVFVSRLVADGTDPMAIRLVLMDHHYRTDWEWTATQLATAEDRLLAYRAAAGARPHDPVLVAELRAALRDDLDTPRALRALDTWARGADIDSIEHPKAADEDGPDDVAAAVDALFGLRL